MDANTLAKSIVDQAIGDKPLRKPRAKKADAVERGKKRIQKMSDAGTLAEHQKKAANSRWRSAGSSVKIKTGE